MAPAIQPPCTRTYCTQRSHDLHRTETKLSGERSTNKRLIADLYALEQKKEMLLASNSEMEQELHEKEVRIGQLEEELVQARRIRQQVAGLLGYGRGGEDGGDGGERADAMEVDEDEEDEEEEGEEEERPEVMEHQEVIRLAQTAVKEEEYLAEKDMDSGLTREWFVLAAVEVISVKSLNSKRPKAVLLELN
ncbi:hypothetical protein N0V95_002598 [Ascochyta clinopodiicola]|nr:hypothetical protein N0V95_002598 [Ascochyta clinopodiicola]